MFFSCAFLKNFMNTHFGCPENFPAENPPLSDFPEENSPVENSPVFFSQIIFDEKIFLVLKIWYSLYQGD